ncbi:putative outer membrane protein [Vibrio ichthyoenteri ATCC 700023]|uniref:Putative outer membrane protein n=1 Tax=Vibrio ichthyoenteri ATCC 700023 TaxID=870968 RepID=F9S2J5_9VIBR|nr:OmpA family protein [Vibrio ichthyoenteri]EGU39541.1 putative outer membrane protein [Vibrio ichthyoenteri ATCC 700023]
MMKNILTFSLISLSLTACVNRDNQYDYIETPRASQVADLQDDDRDGVINARDLCTETPIETQIDNDGCGLIITSSEELGLHILFENDSSEISPLFEGQIRQMADFLKQYPETSIEIQGYASKVGNADYNLALSKQRAIAVDKKIESLGISADRVTIVGYGETHLEDLGDDEISHARNRKVVANVVGYKGDILKEWTIFTRLPK